MYNLENVETAKKLTRDPRANGAPPAKKHFARAPPCIEPLCCQEVRKLRIEAQNGLKRFCLGLKLGQSRCIQQRQGKQRANFQMMKVSNIWRGHASSRECGNTTNREWQPQTDMWREAQTKRAASSPWHWATLFVENMTDRNVQGSKRLGLGMNVTMLKAQSRWHSQNWKVRCSRNICHAGNWIVVWNPHKMRELSILLSPRPDGSGNMLVL